MWDGSDVRSAVRRALEGAGDRTPLRDVEVCEVGTGSLVLLTPRTAVRVARDRQRGPEIERAQRLVDSLPDLPFAVPHSTGPTATAGGATAIPTMRLSGEVHPPRSGDPGPLRELLDAVHGVELGPSCPDLAQRHAFMGGDGWERVLRDRVVPLLQEDLREEARARIDAYASLAPVDLCFGHGDLAGTNVLWSGGAVSGVLDWDLATLEDPEEDLASLAWWHGWNVIDAIAPGRTPGRAETYRDLFPLQMIAFHVLHDGDEAGLARLLERTAPLLQQRTVC